MTITNNHTSIPSTRKARSMFIFVCYLIRQQDSHVFAINKTLETIDLAVTEYVDKFVVQQDFILVIKLGSKVQIGAPPEGN